jgi:competence protein ComEC
VKYWGGSLASDWLLVGHHGSATSTSWTFLKHVQPAVAVISSGYANRFGHPHVNVLARLHESGAAVHGTATGGALQYEFSPRQPVQVRRWREYYKRFWM